MTTSSAESWLGMPMVELLENDRRPIFIIDLDIESAYTVAPLQPVFYNESLRRFPALQEAICKDTAKSAHNLPHLESYGSFKRWICQHYHASNLNYAPINFRAMTWDAITVGHFNVISARLGARPYTASFMETLLLTGPAKSEFDLGETYSPGLSSLRNRYTPLSGPSSTGLEDPTAHHSRSVSVSYFSPFPGGSTLERDTPEESEPLLSDKLLLDTSVSNPTTTDELSNYERDLLVSRYMQTLADLRIQREETIKRTDLLDRISAIEAVAISVISADGELVFANEEWYRMCSFPKGVTSALAWMNVFLEEDLPKAYEVWETTMIQARPMKFEARFKTPWKPPFHVDGEADEGPTWISATIYPDLSEEGVVTGGTGCIQDISEQKWLERVQKRKTEEAVERASLLEALNKRVAEAQAKEREARESDIRFRRLADLMPFGIFISDDNRHRLYANDKALEMFNMDSDLPAEVMPWDTLFFPDDVPAAKEFWRCVVDDQKSSTIEARMKTFGTTDDPEESVRRWIVCTGIPECNSDGSFRHVTVCVVDVTTIKEAEELQRQRVVDVTEARQRQEAFIDMTSHEIRNPLSSIVHSADEILQCLSKLPIVSEGRKSISTEALDSAIEAADTILFCTQHSRRIVDDILCLSKLNSNLLPISLIPTEAKRTVGHAMKMFEGELRAADITWKMDIDASLDRLGVTWVSLDTSRILQILVNLIGNSVKFTQFEDKRELRVTLSATTTKPSQAEHEAIQYLLPLKDPVDDGFDPEQTLYLKYIVQDTGCGISVDGQRILFTRFTQDSTRTHVKYGGNGLGLFISRQLCELQGGQMGFHSIEGQGSTFAFFVKTARVSPPSDSIPTNAMRVNSITAAEVLSSAHIFQSDTSTTKLDAVAASIIPPPNAAADHIHILLVEDNLINQRVLGQQLRKRGYKVNIANHGEEALSHIQTTRLWTNNNNTGNDLTIILMDIEMPVLNGLDCARRIRDLQKAGSIHAHIPIVAVTANARPQQVDDAFTAGMDDIISKPFRMPELVTLIDSIIAKAA
ncbi:hypothetical protein AAFC00_000785 [Neodothiora populina]